MRRARGNHPLQTLRPVSLLPWPAGLRASHSGRGFLAAVPVGSLAIPSESLYPPDGSPYPPDSLGLWGLPDSDSQGLAGTVTVLLVAVVPPAVRHHPCPCPCVGAGAGERVARFGEADLVSQSEQVVALGGPACVGVAGGGQA